MGRGVLVGGLMIFGSFLLATMLNRCAMEEAAPSASSSARTVQAAQQAHGATHHRSRDEHSEGGLVDTGLDLRPQ